MKRSGIILSLLCLSLLTGCGGEVTKINTSALPAISNLSISPESATQFQGGGAVTIEANFDYEDLDGDISILNLKTPLGSQNIPLEGISGKRVGKITGKTIFPTNVKGSFPYEIYVLDSKGNKSNVLSGFFVVN